MVMTANEAMAADAGDNRKEIDEAADFLRDLLEDGSRCAEGYQERGSRRRLLMGHCASREGTAGPQGQQGRHAWRVAMGTPIIGEDAQRHRRCSGLKGEHLRNE